MDFKIDKIHIAATLSGAKTAVQPVEKLFGIAHEEQAGHHNDKDHKDDKNKKAAPGMFAGGGFFNPMDL